MRLLVLAFDEVASLGYITTKTRIALAGIGLTTAQVEKYLLYRGVNQGV